MDRSKLVTVRQNAECSITMTAMALSRGYPLGRAMTSRERLVVAVVQAEPSHFLTIDSPDKSRADMTRAFRCIRLRLQRSRGRRAAPVIYVATFPCTKDRDGHHLHALLWGYVHIPKLLGYCRGLGLGKPKMEQISASTPGDPNYWRPIGYVLGQHGPAFGSRDHDRHEPLPKGKRELVYPHRMTLARHCPKLLSALDMARDPSVSDETLCAGLPRFSNT